MDPDKIIEKSIEEGAKQTIGKMVDGVSSLLSTICKPAAEEFGLYLRDRIAIFRVTNLYNVISKVRKKLPDDLRKHNQNVSPKLIKGIIDESSWSDDEIVQEMWAGLLSGAVINDEVKDESIIYVNQLKDLSAYEARLINLIYSDFRIASVTNPGPIEMNFFRPSNVLKFTMSAVLDLSPTPLDYIIKGRSHDAILSNERDWGLALGHIKPQIDSLVRRGLIDHWREDSRYFIVFAPTSAGLDLYMRCTGYKIYPLEAYLLSRQNWAKNEGIDPKNWQPEELIKLIKRLGWE
jgi:hypothetical protein